MSQKSMSEYFTNYYKEVVAWNRVCKPVTKEISFNSLKILHEELLELNYFYYREKSHQYVIDIADACADVAFSLFGIGYELGIDEMDFDLLEDLDLDTASSTYSSFVSLCCAVDMEDTDWFNELIKNSFSEILETIISIAREEGFDLQRVCNEVMRSNWSKYKKTSIGYEAVLDKNNKVVKPDTYSPPDLSFVNG